MFRGIRSYARALLEALQELALAVKVIAQAQDIREDATIGRRVDDLERSRALWEAEVEGLLAKATQERQNARNAEERARTKERNARALAGDEGGEEGIPEEYLQILQSGHAPRGPEEGVPPVRQGVARTRDEKKAAVKRFKFGG